VSYIPQNSLDALLDAIQASHEELLDPPQFLKDDQDPEKKRLKEWKPKVRKDVDWEAVRTHVKVKVKAGKYNYTGGMKPQEEKEEKVLLGDELEERPDDDDDDDDDDDAEAKGPADEGDGGAIPPPRREWREDKYLTIGLIGTFVFSF